MIITQIFYNINKFVLNPIIMLGFAIAVGLFFWGGIMMMISQQNGDLANAARYRKHLMWSIVGIFIMASVYGIMEIITNSIRSVGI